MTQLLQQPERIAIAAKVLVETGVLRPERPGKLAEAARDLLRWKIRRRPPSSSPRGLKEKGDDEEAD
jgi:hypothetical protein